MRVLFISGPIGLGHVGREVEIAKELRKLDPNVEILWYAEDPASRYLKEAGEPEPFSLEPEAMTTHYAEKYSNDAYSCNLHDMFWDWRKTFPKRIGTYLKIAKENDVDLVVGDETMELLLAIGKKPEIKQFKLIYVTDFFGTYNMDWNLKHMLGVRVFNQGWTRTMRTPGAFEKFIWIGEKEDIPDEKMGLFLPSRKTLSDKYMDFVGYILTFKPEDYANQKRMKKELGYDPDRPLVICTVGGSSAGRGLLSLCAKAYPFLKEEVPDVQMALVAGPHIDPSSIKTTDGEKVVGYVPQLYKHFAAADMVVTSAGGTTALELTALQKPFLYFPLLKHFEQNREVVPSIERHKAGTKMDFLETTPETLAKSIAENIGKKVNYPKLPLEGASKIAKMTHEVLHS